MGKFSSTIFRVARESGTKVLIECDSDGEVSILQAPLRWLRLKMWDEEYTVKHKAGILKVWLKSWLIEGKSQEIELLKSFTQADWIKIESELPAEALRRFCESRERPDLAAKVIVIPFAVRELFTEKEILNVREELIIVAGRLGAQQKNPKRLRRVLEEFCPRFPHVNVELHLRGSAPDLSGMPERFPGLTVFLDSTREHLAQRLASARIFLSTSRFETTPVIGLEALCSGCSLVAPADVPGYASLIEGNRFGACAGRSVAEGVSALVSEYELWRDGQRDATEIAAHWRRRCSLSAVAHAFLALGDAKTIMAGGNS